MKQVKQDSSKWINNKGFIKGKFSWQAGYGAFSYAKSEIPSVIAYIQDQDEHHRTQSFQDEYIELLERFEIDYDDRYLIKEIE